MPWCPLSYGSARVVLVSPLEPLILKIFCSLLKKTSISVPRDKKSVSTRTRTVAMELIKNKGNEMSQFRGGFNLENTFLQANIARVTYLLFSKH